MGVIAQKFTSDISQLEAAYSKLQSQNAQLINQNTKLTKESEKASRSSQKNAGSMGQYAQSAMGSIAGMISSYATLQGAITLVNRALDDQLRVSQSIADFGAKVAPSQAGLAINMNGMAPAEKSRILSEIIQIDKDTSFGNQSSITQSVGSLVSATGDIDLALNVTRELGDVMRERPDELAPTAGAVGDVAALVGDETGRKSLGLVLSTLASSRVEKINAFGNLTQGMAATSAYESAGSDKFRSAEVSASLMAALTRGIADKDGSVSRTAAIGLAEQLSKFLPEKDRLEGDGSVARAGTGLRTLEERIAAVQGDELLRRQFLEKATFERTASGAVLNLLQDPNSNVAKQYSANVGGRVSAEISLLEELKSDMTNLTPQFKSGKFNKGVKAEVDAFLAQSNGDTFANVKGMMDPVLPHTRRSGGFTPGYADDLLVQETVRLAAGMGQSPADVAATQLRAREANIVQSAGAGESFINEQGNIDFRNLDASMLDEQEVAKLKLLDGVLGKLEQITGNMERTQLSGALNLDRGGQREAER